MNKDEDEEEEDNEAANNGDVGSYTARLLMPPTGTMVDIELLKVCGGKCALRCLLPCVPEPHDTVLCRAQPVPHTCA